MDAIPVLVRVSRRDIATLCNFFAAYEGIAIVRTLDGGRGLVELLVAPDFYPTALTLLQVLQEDMDVHLLASSPSQSS